MTPREQWVEALRSGKYSQTRGRLGDENGFCCLGVACEIALEAGVINRYQKSEGTPPSSVQEWLGLNWSNATFYDNESMTNYSSLASLNDRGESFDSIADVIESNPEGLFNDPA